MQRRQCALQTGYSLLTLPPCANHQHIRTILAGIPNPSRHPGSESSNARLQTSTTSPRKSATPAFVSTLTATSTKPSVRAKSPTPSPWCASSCPEPGTTATTAYSHSTSRPKSLSTVAPTCRHGYDERRCNRNTVMPANDSAWPAAHHGVKHGSGKHLQGS